MALLDEWNNSAVAVIIILFLIPVTIIFLLILWLIKFIPGIETFIEEKRKSNSAGYLAFLFLLFIISAFSTLGILNLLR